MHLGCSRVISRLRVARSQTLTALSPASSKVGPFAVASHLESGEKAIA